MPRNKHLYENRMFTNKVRRIRKGGEKKSECKCVKLHLLKVDPEGLKVWAFLQCILMKEDPIWNFNLEVKGEEKEGE